MAEIVQQRIEEMLPELEQMKRIELFTEKETRSVNDILSPNLTACTTYELYNISVMML